MRTLIFTLALAAIVLSGCKDEAVVAESAADVPVPVEYAQRETKVVRTLADCEERVRDMTKGGDVSAQAAGDGVIVYEFMLNSGRRIWQSCSVQDDGRYLHVFAFSDEPLQ